MLTEKILKTIVISILAFSIVVFAFFIRRYTFWEPHWNGDQEIYIALAMKLDKFGLDGYNLLGISVRKTTIPVGDGKAQLWIGETIPDKKGGRGYMVDARMRQGLFFYNTPLYHIAPAFPFMLKISNDLFGNNRFQGAVMPLNRQILKVRPEVYFKAQFYAAIVPLAFSLILVFCTFYLGRLLFSTRIGLYASFIMAINPVDILSSQRIWTEDMCTAFIAISMIFFVLSLKNPGKIIHPILCGLSLGIATLTRQSSVLILASYFLFLGITNISKIKKPSQIMKDIFSKNMLLISFVFAASTSFWFYKVFRVHGNPFYMPDIASALATDKTGWVGNTLSRPHPLILLAVNSVYMCPPLVFVYANFKDAFFSFKKAVTGSRFEPLAFLWAIVLVLLVQIVAMGNILKEERYFLPMYPALSIIAAYAMYNFKNMLSRELGPKQVLLPEILVLVFLILSALWSIPIGNDAAFINKSVLLKPF